jgi:hypothetical protein
VKLTTAVIVSYILSSLPFITGRTDNGYPSLGLPQIKCLPNTVFNAERMLLVDFSGSDDRIKNK